MVLYAVLGQLDQKNNFPRKTLVKDFLRQRSSFLSHITIDTLLKETQEKTLC